jgi:hypothetical protein
MPFHSSRRQLLGAREEVAEFPLVAATASDEFNIASGLSPAPRAAEAVSGSDQSIPSSMSSMYGLDSGLGEGNGTDVGEGVLALQDESLQRPLSSVLNSLTAHQSFAHGALLQMNLQSDTRALRGGL